MHTWSILLPLFLLSVDQFQMTDGEVALSQREGYNNGPSIDEPSEKQGIIAPEYNIYMTHAPGSPSDRHEKNWTVSSTKHQPSTSTSFQRVQASKPPVSLSFLSTNLPAQVTNSSDSVPGEDFTPPISQAAQAASIPTSQQVQDTRQPASEKTTKSPPSQQVEVTKPLVSEELSTTNQRSSLLTTANSNAHPPVSQLVQSIQATFPPASHSVQVTDTFASKQRQSTISAIQGNKSTARRLVQVTDPPVSQSMQSIKPRASIVVQTTDPPVFQPIRTTNQPASGQVRNIIQTKTQLAHISNTPAYQRIQTTDFQALITAESLPPQTTSRTTDSKQTVHGVNSANSELLTSKQTVDEGIVTIDRVKHVQPVSYTRDIIVEENATSTVTSNSTINHSSSTFGENGSVFSVVLISCLSFGIIFFVVVTILVSRRIYDGWQKRHYSRIDYLVDGMYN